MMRVNADRHINWIKGVPLVLCFVLGIVGFFFFVWKGNYGATGLTMYMEIICIVVLRMNIYYIRNEIPGKLSERATRIVKIIGLIGAIIFFFSGVGNILLAIMNKQGFQWENTGYYAAAIPAFLGSFWSFILFLDCRSFETLYVQPVGYLPQI